jgi:hypothetical protein
MALARWKDLCVDANDPGVAAAFWAGALALTGERLDDGDWVLRGERPEQTVWVNRVPEPKTVKNRVHLDVRVPVADLLALGARVQREPEGDDRWHVLLDPEGNELCAFPLRADQPARLYEVNVDSADAGSQAAWWADVLGGEHVDDGNPWHSVQGVEGMPFAYLVFAPVPEPKTVKNRVHWDVECDDVDALVAKGATLVRAPDGAGRWHVLADPEGNEFCAFGSA